MPNIKWLDPCGDATQVVASFLHASSGTVTVDTSTFQQTGSGAGAAYKCDRTASNVSASVTIPEGAAILADAGRRISVWVRISALPSAQDDFIWLQDSSGNAILKIDVTTAGKLKFAITGGNLGTTVLSTNTWYRITWSYTITSTTVYHFRVYINGVQELDQTSGFTLPRTGSDGIVMACGTTSWGASAIAWFDHLYVDDGSDFSDPGDIRLTAKLPNANNVNNFNTAIGNNPANRWQNVNERPLSITNGWEDTQGAGGIRENYGIEGASAGDVDISSYAQVGYLGWIWSKEGTVAGSPKITVNGTDTAITLTTSAALYTAITTGVGYPSNAAAIGMVSGTSVSGTFLYECGVVIAYNFGAGAFGPYNPWLGAAPVLAM